MMYDKLYEYLIQDKELPVPGIGTFLLERKSAVIDFPNRKINPSSYTIALEAASHLPDPFFFNWLGLALGISDREAIFRFNDFAFDMKKQISEGSVINWMGVGSLNKDVSGGVRLTPYVAEQVFEKPIPAEKVIRERAEHMIRVGEDEKTSGEMTEMLSLKEEKKSNWLAYPLAVVLLASIFIVWYFSENGLDITSTGNRQKLIPQDAGATYQTLP